MPKLWQKGRGTLGVFAPLMGEWTTKTKGPDGKPMLVERSFETVLGGKYVEMRVVWHIAKKPYEEICLFGVNKEKQLCFWSFTNDGKQSHGQLDDGTDIHAEALCFSAHMDAGFARQIYWPNTDGSWSWAVESQTKKGWNRFVEHQYESAS